MPLGVGDGGIRQMRRPKWLEKRSGVVLGPNSVRGPSVAMLLRDDDRDRIVTALRAAATGEIPALAEGARTGRDPYGKDPPFKLRKVGHPQTARTRANGG